MEGQYLISILYLDTILGKEGQYLYYSWILFKKRKAVSTIYLDTILGKEGQYLYYTWILF